ncbi:hypothetical protein H4W80_001607 [Nonomuraea angiospora]|uniref:Uncharacterized protein n=1 Tax=Nonomuraea angiospora TaxID=46172 RepID=A0ABR9LRS0_9ACTN|nr:hypothetical protein [Nonomuraea angiospora]
MLTTFSHAGQIHGLRLDRFNRTTPSGLVKDSPPNGARPRTGTSPGPARSPGRAQGCAAFVAVRDIPRSNVPPWRSMWSLSGPVPPASCSPPSSVSRGCPRSWWRSCPRAAASPRHSACSRARPRCSSRVVCWARSPTGRSSACPADISRGSGSTSPPGTRLTRTCSASRRRASKSSSKPGRRSWGSRCCAVEG